MTVQEVERQSGLERATIRYYEKEGLISPSRAKNGYRDYSDVDLELLQKIKLLRSLNMSLEEIRSVKNGDTQLTEVLDRLIKHLEDDGARIKSSQRVCREMMEASVTFEALDAGQYLKSLEQTVSPLPSKPLEPDAAKPLCAPWRRYFARFFDNLLYSAIWCLLLTAVFRTQVTLSSLQELLGTLFTIFMVLAVEPLLLKLCGTTPGKWLCGLYVTDESGGRLSYFDALSRTWSVLWRGYGLFIPVYSLVRLWKCKRAQENGEKLPWEEDTVLELRGRRLLRTASYIACCGLCCLLFCVIQFSAQMPRNRGDITPAQFTENFNDLLDYYDYELGYSLLPDGGWEADYLKDGGTVEGDMIRYDSGYGTVFTAIPSRPADIDLAVEDGLLVGVSFRYDSCGDDVVNLYNARVQMLLTAASFAGAQKQVRVLSNDMHELMESVKNDDFESYQFDVGNMTVSCVAEQSGYYYSSDMLLAKNYLSEAVENGELTSAPWYSISFSITKKQA